MCPVQDSVKGYIAVNISVLNLFTIIIVKVANKLYLVRGMLYTVEYSIKGFPKIPYGLS